MLTRLAMGIAAGALSLLTIGCDDLGARRETGSHRPVDIAVTRALAYDCGETCPSIIADFRVSNKSSQVYCVSEDYRNYHAADHVRIIDLETSQALAAVRSTGMRPPGPNGGDEARALSLLGQGNLIVQPGETIDIRAMMEGLFELPKRPSRFEIGFITYPCDAAALKRSGPTIQTAATNLEFQRRRLEP
jgi:hypothetical protein